MAKRNKTAVSFRRLASRAYLHPWSGRVLDSVGEDEEQAFHKMHRRWLKDSPYKLGNTLEDRYPFVKVDGQWYVSIPKLYLYLFAVRGKLASFKDKDMRCIYDAIQNASRYYDAVKEIDRKLTPHRHMNYDDYQNKLSELYKEYETKQRSLFGDMLAG